MKRMARRGISILLLTLIMSLFVCGTACAATIPEHTSNFYVNDFAGVFTDEQVKVMMDKAVKLCEEHDGAQVVITTVQSLEGETVENYANQMYNKYKIGKDSMGVLVLMSVNDRKIRVEVGRTMQVYIPDSKAAKLMNTYAIPKLKQNMFAEGLMDLQDALVNEITASLSGTAVEGEAESENPDVGMFFLIFVFVCIMIFGIIPLIIEHREEKKRQERMKRLLERRLYENNSYISNSYPISRRYSGSYPTSRRYFNSNYTGYSSYSGDSSSSRRSSSWSNNDSYSSSYSDDSSSYSSFDSSSDDSSSYSGFDGCSDGGGASDDF